MSEERSFSSSEALSFGWNITKQNFVSLFLPLGALTLILSGAEGTAQRQGQSLLHLLLQVVSMLITMAWWRITLHLHDGKSTGLGALSEVTVILFIRYFLTIVFFWIVVGIGLVLLVVPGVYLASRLFLAPTLVIDEELEPVAALQRSWELTDGALVEILVLGLFVLGINILGAIPVGLGLLASIPTSFLAIVYAYRRLAARKPARASTGAPIAPTSAA
jgi:uncharacterized membrane protein